MHDFKMTPRYRYYRPQDPEPEFQEIVAESYERDGDVVTFDNVTSGLTDLRPTPNRIVQTVRGDVEIIE